MHELTEKIKPVVFGNVDTAIKQSDRIIREWLEEKAKQIYQKHLDYQWHKDGFSVAHVEKILGISEPTLEEKFKNYFSKRTKSSMIDISSDLAKIAEEHFKQ